MDLHCRRLLLILLDFDVGIDHTVAPREAVHKREQIEVDLLNSLWISNDGFLAEGAHFNDQFFLAVLDLRVPHHRVHLGHDRKDPEYGLLW